MKRTGCISIILIALFINEPLLSDAHQEPVFDVSKQDIIFRRTTLIVRDIDTSLMLYREALGMKVIYDNILQSTDGTESRLIFLKTTDEYVGILGLWELDYGNPSSDRRKLPIERKAFVPQGNIHLFNTNDLETKWKRAIKVPGVEVYREPSYREYPSYDGSDVIKVNVSIIFDPDGNMIELNQLLTPIKK